MSSQFPDKTAEKRIFYGAGTQIENIALHDTSRMEVVKTKLRHDISKLSGSKTADPTMIAVLETYLNGIIEMVDIHHNAQMRITNELGKMLQQLSGLRTLP